LAGKYDIALIGGGITGLMAAQKLCDLGMRVALIEQHNTLASGPSTRNEGWLHRGTYHAASIKDRRTAIQVARRCIYGHKQLRRFAPEAIEDDGVAPYAMIRDKNRIDEVTSRWDEAEVRYKPVTINAIKNLAPGTDLDRAAAIFEVGDVSLNTRLLYRKLYTLARKAGCVFLMGYQIIKIDGQLAVFSNNDEQVTLEARKFVYSAGTGTKDIFRTHHDIELAIRYWKSHLVVTQRLSKVGLFYLDSHEAAIMHHGDTSIIGLNEDALLCTKPSYDVLPDRAANLKNAIRRIYPEWDANKSIDIACTKVDLVTDLSESRSLNIAITEPITGHVCVLPGKMTEAPYLTDILTAYLHDHLDNPAISLRPCDHYVASLPSLQLS